MRKILVFDIWGDLAHFKKPYTTTSPLTHSVPPGTVLAGILAALTGKEKGNYFSLFRDNKYFLAIGIEKTIKKTRIAINLINTRTAIKMSKIKNRTQIRTEFLCNPCYRIYFSHKDESFYQEVKNNLKNHTSIYTVSLGLSENLANFNYVGEYRIEQKDNKENDFILINSIMRTDDYTKGDISFEEGEFFTETVSLEMKDDREVIKYIEILLERTGKKIKAKVKKYWHVEELNINICSL